MVATMMMERGKTVSSSPCVLQAGQALPVLVPLRQLECGSVTQPDSGPVPGPWLLARQLLRWLL